MAGGVFFRKSRRSSLGSLSSNDEKLSLATRGLSNSCHGCPELGRPTVIHKPLRSCMSVSSLEASLQSVRDKSPDSQFADTSAHSAPALLMSEQELLPRKISFTKVEFREYERTLSDNPSVTVGPPLGIGWFYNEAGTFEIEDYEKSKQYRRDATQLRVPSVVRESILREEWGVSRQELQRAVKQINIVKNQRRKTQATMELEVSAFAVESAVRKFKRLAGLVPRKNKEDQMLWKNAEGYALEAKQKRRDSLTVVQEEELMQKITTPTTGENPIEDTESDEWALGNGLDLEKVPSSSSE